MAKELMTLTVEEVRNLMDVGFEKFRLSVTGIVDDNFDREVLRMFFNQGVIEALAWVKNDLLKPLKLETDSEIAKIVKPKKVNKHGKTNKTNS